MSKNKLDEFHYHEALDRMNLMCDIIEESVVHHPVIDKHGNLKKKVLKAQQLLSEVYQEIGSKSYYKFKKKKK